MNLTPIKVPGKNKRDKSKTALAARKALNRKPGRPLKLPQNANSKTPLSTYKQIKETKKRTLKTIKSKRKMSFLEKLPTELLERVFQFCLNLDLPKASPVIAAKLSSQMVFSWTVMKIFGPTWERWYGRERKRMGKSEGGGEGDGGEEWDAMLQSRVLRCRWASLEVLLRAKDGWVKKYARDRPFKPIYFLKDSNPPPESPPDEDEDAPPHPSPTLTPEEYLNLDYSGFLTFISQPEGPWPWDEISWTTYSDLASGIEIPHSLLLGPFNRSSQKYLFHLIKSGATLSWLTSTSGEVALEGLRTAISTGNVESIHLLVWSGLIEKLDVELLCWAFRNAGGGVERRVKTVNQLLRLGFTVLGARERGRVERELMELRDEGVMEGDEEKVSFVREVVGSEMLRGKIDINV